MMYANIVDWKMTETKNSRELRTFSDGGSRGNPGPAAIAFIVQSETGQTIARNARYVGICTNNQAEYYALLAALEACVAMKAEILTCHLDSELVVKQLSGEYRVKNEELSHLWRRVQEIKEQFKKITFINVPRSHIIIQEADTLVNITLDMHNK